MNKAEAQRIASAINVMRPEWSTGLLMAVLGDDRMIRRPYADALIALTVLATDEKSKKPGRVHDNGIWWAAVTATVGQEIKYRTITNEDCAICTRPENEHNLPTLRDHDFEPYGSRNESALPTPEQKAALEAARIEAEKKRTAAREDEVKREPRDPAEVIASHLPEEKAS